jgi:hypothetical protein
MRYQETHEPGRTRLEFARLDAVYQPIAVRPVDIMASDAFDNIGARTGAELAQFDFDEQATRVLRAVIERYAAGDGPARAAIRQLFDRYTSFRWAALLPAEWTTAEEFRARLLHLSARDQGSDTRDEILTLRELCGRALRAGIDISPVLGEVAAIFSDIDRYGMGSMRSVILDYGKRKN